MKIVFTQEEMKKLLEACKILCSDNKCNPDKLNVVNLAIEDNKVIAYATDRYQFLKITFNNNDMIKEAPDNMQNGFIIGYKVANLYGILLSYLKKTDTSIANIYIIDTKDLDNIIVNNNIFIYVKDILVFDNVHLDIRKYKSNKTAPQALISPYCMLKLAKILKVLVLVKDEMNAIKQTTHILKVLTTMTTEWECEDYKVEILTTLCKSL